MNINVKKVKKIFISLFHTFLILLVCFIFIFIIINHQLLFFFLASFLPSFAETFFHDCKIVYRHHMPSGRLSLMNLEPAYKMEMESIRIVQDIQHEFWPLDEIDPENAKFPCCLVWTPLPVVSWLAPFIGHVGICTEDGSAVAFSGSNFINADDFAFGSVAKYLQLDRKQCCFPRNLAAHTCKHGYKHSEFGSALTWDDAIQSSVRNFEHKSYNLFTCNSYSFLANCLKRLCYGGSMDWNMINVGALLLFKGHWVDNISILRSFSPFILVVCFGILMVGWPFLVALLAFSLLLLAWFIFATYCFKNLLDS